MVWPFVPVHTSEILRIFRMGYITVYLLHKVAPQRLLRCITTLPGTVKFLTPLPFRETSLMKQARQHMLLCLIGAQPNGMSFVTSLYEYMFDFWSHV